MQSTLSRDEDFFTKYEADTVTDTVVAFSARQFSEEIEGQDLYQEKYHKEKIKTLTVALVICLNIDVDPPDVQKIPPFSRMEAWFDPTDANSIHALDTIGKNLQSQYERWQPRARYKQCLDPTLDDVKKLCLTLRRNAKDDRILFHYNGHGVPRPTVNGEIWVFNTKFTKYIPLSLYDLQRWLGAPSVYVLDCQNAGRIIHMYAEFCERRKNEATLSGEQKQEQENKSTRMLNHDCSHHLRDRMQQQHHHHHYFGGGTIDQETQAQQIIPPSASTTQTVTMENTIMLAACGPDENLPQDPNLPADLFTACLTTPIRVALRWHWLKHQEYFPGYLDESLLDRIPGSHSNRMSLLGEVNWIFTAVTDTIAWCSFPIDIFQKLFRQDLLVASLFRNFLLAERVMKTYGCQPVSAPPLPATFRHSMWNAWDHTLDRLVHYLPKMLKVIEGSPFVELNLPIISPGCASIVNQQNKQPIPTVNNVSDAVGHHQVVNRMDTVPTTCLGVIAQPVDRRTLTHLFTNNYMEHPCKPTNVNQQPLHKVPQQMASNLQAQFQMRDRSTHLSCKQTHRQHNVVALPSGIVNGKLEHRATFQGSRPPLVHTTVTKLTNDLQQSGIKRDTQVNINHSNKQRTIKVTTDSDSRSRPTAQVDQIQITKPHTSINQAHSPVKTKTFCNQSKRNTTKQALPENSSVLPAVKCKSNFAGDNSVVMKNTNDIVEEDSEEDSDTSDIDFEDGRICHRCVSYITLVPVRKSAELLGAKSTVHRRRHSYPDSSCRFGHWCMVSANDTTAANTVSTKKTDVEQASTKCEEPHQSVTKLCIANQPNTRSHVLTSAEVKLKKDSTTGATKTSAPAYPKTTLASTLRRPAFPTAPIVEHHKTQTTIQQPVTGIVQPSTKTTQQQKLTQPSHQPTPVVNSGSVIGGSGPVSFFTSQMTAFKVWLRTVNEKRPPAVQLPILLQILLSQSHRIRAMQLLSEFLDLGPWAVVQCLTVGIFPYIVRLFHSPVPEVKPHLVFIWGKIIASAQTEFGRNDSVRDFGYKYFISCLGDSENLSPLTRTITAFALAKMLEKNQSGEPDAFFQDMYLRQNFVPIVVTQLFDNLPTCEDELQIRMRLWLILSLAKLWCKHDEARWCGIRHNLPELLTSYLNDVSPEVRSATVYALATLIDNSPLDLSKQNHADQISQEIGGHLVKVAARDANPLVRRLLVEAFRGLVKQFTPQLCAVALKYIQELKVYERQPTTTPQTPADSVSVAKRHVRNSALFIINPRSVNKQTAPSGKHTSSNFAAQRNTSSSPTVYPRAYLPTTANIKATTTNAGATFFTGNALAHCNNIYVHFWVTLIELSQDAYPEVSRLASVLVNYLLEKSDHGNCISTLGLHNQSATVAAEVVPNEDNLVRKASQHENTNSDCETTYSPRGPTVSINPSCLTHSAQFPGRRYHQVDQRIRHRIPSTEGEIQFSAQSEKDSTSFTANDATTSIETGEHEVGSQHKNALAEDTLKCVQTPFFAWSCRWFTYPLLSKYEYCNELQRKTAQSTMNNVNENRSSEIISHISNSRLQTQIELENQLSVLGAVSVDPHVVGFADRVNRFRAQRHFALQSKRDWAKLANISRPLITSPTSTCSSNDQEANNRLSYIQYPNVQLDTCHIMLKSRVMQSIDHGGPTHARFHPYQDHIILADSIGVSVWSDEALTPLHYLPSSKCSNLFSDKSLDYRSNQSNSIGGVEFINAAEEQTLLLTSTKDGRIRVWRNYTRQFGQDPEIVTAWNGVGADHPTTPSNVIVQWDQKSNQLILSGDMKIIRLWDCAHECRLRDLYTGTDVQCTSLNRSTDSNLISAGFVDGTIRVYDIRIPSLHMNDSILHTGQLDCAPVHNVALNDVGRLFAVNGSGGIGLWQLTAHLNEAKSHSSARYVSTYVKTATLKSCDDIVGKRDGIEHVNRRFRRLPCPSNLPIQPNTMVKCADFLVHSSLSTANLLAAGIGSTRLGQQPELLLYRIHDGVIHSFYKCPATNNEPTTIISPTVVALHPFKPYLLMGLDDGSVSLLVVRPPEK